MTGISDDTDDAQISSDAVYWPMHMDPFGEVTFHLSDKATGAFVRFLNFYVKRNGNVPFDEGKLCDRLRYKTVRSLRPVWDELCDAGVVAVTKGMVTCAFGDFVLEKVRKARKQKVEAGEAGGAAKARAMAERKGSEGASERSTGVPGEYNGNTAGIAAETWGTIQQNHEVTSDSASNLKPETFKEKTPPTSPSVSPGQSGGGSDVQKIIEEFFRIAGCIWGPDVAAKERINTSKNVGHAGEWLRLADGSVGLVLQLIEPALTKYASNNGCPGTLGAIYRSMPGMIASALAAPRSTNGNGKSLTYAGPSRGGDDEPWMKIRKLATSNWHDDVALEIQRRAREISDEEANRFAEDMRSYVSTKKAQAAA